MAKNRYLWIAVAVAIIIIGAFLITSRSKAPSDLQQVEKPTADNAPVNIDLENDTDFEQDADDLNINEEVLEDTDSNDFDEEAIDDNVL